MNTETKIRKSIRLSPEEWKALKRYRKEFESELDCAKAMGIERSTLNRTILLGSASEPTIKALREILDALDY